MSEPMPRAVLDSQSKLNVGGGPVPKAAHTRTRGATRAGHGPAGSTSAAHKPECAVLCLSATLREFTAARLTGKRRPVRHPSHMSPTERVAELGGILARGYRRLLVSRETELDVVPGAERSYDEPVNTPEERSPRRSES